MYSTNNNIWIRNLESNKGPGMITWNKDLSVTRIDSDKNTIHKH